MAIPAPYSHQKQTSKFILAQPHALVQNDPGTGKTRSVIDAHAERNDGRMLVFAPLSILKPSWLDDIKSFQPGMTAGIAHGKYREAIFESDCDIVITNHDAIKWIAKNSRLVTKSKRPFTTLTIDESPAFKHGTSQRSKAMKLMSNFFENRILMSGTMYSNSILDIWHQALICDGGRRLGNKFWAFRDQVCSPQQVGPDPRHLKWDEKPGARELVADLLRDITIRFRFEDCIDIPEHSVHNVFIDPPAKLMAQYRELEKRAVLETKQGNITAIHAGALSKKLLQLMSGAVYDSAGKVVSVHKERYELVLDMVEAREQCLVAFNWTHERDALCEMANARGIPYGVIDGSTPTNTRTAYVEQFQAGLLKVIFAHPQSASHGLTMTSGTSTIWTSPTYNAELFIQFNRRIYRAGQKRKTETICIAANGTKEIDVYEKLNSRIDQQNILLDIFESFTSQGLAA